MASTEEMSPSFSWLNERSESGIPLLQIKFPNSKNDDLAILHRYNPIPIEADESRSKVNDCIFKGFLKNEPSAKVIMTGGCPGESSFDVNYLFLNLTFYRTFT